MRLMNYITPLANSLLIWLCVLPAMTHCTAQEVDEEQAKGLFSSYLYNFAQASTKHSFTFALEKGFDEENKPPSYSMRFGEQAIDTAKNLERSNQRLWGVKNLTKKYFMGEHVLNRDGKMYVRSTLNASNPKIEAPKDFTPQCRSFDPNVAVLAYPNVWAADLMNSAFVTKFLGIHFFVGGDMHQQRARTMWMHTSKRWAVGIEFNEDDLPVHVTHRFSPTVLEMTDSPKTNLDNIAKWELICTTKSKWTKAGKNKDVFVPEFISMDQLDLGRKSSYSFHVFDWKLDDEVDDAVFEVKHLRNESYDRIKMLQLEEEVVRKMETRKKSAN